MQDGNGDHGEDAQEICAAVVEALRDQSPAPVQDPHPDGAADPGGENGGGPGCYPGLIEREDVDHERRMPESEHDRRQEQPLLRRDPGGPAGIFQAGPPVDLFGRSVERGAEEHDHCHVDGQMGKVAVGPDGYRKEQGTVDQEVLEPCVLALELEGEPEALCLEDTSAFAPVIERQAPDGSPVDEEQWNPRQ